jgi:hypothetical protein
MTKTSVPKPPAGTGDAGQRLWDSVCEQYDLETHELVLLREATATLDVLAELDTAVRRDGTLTPSGSKVHPAVVESRQQRIVLARLMAALRLPSGDESDRPQRRVGVRGTYGLRPVS